MTWNNKDPQGRESEKIKHVIVPYTRGHGLDLGAGPWKAWPHFVSVDNHDEWSGLDWRPDIESDCTDLSMFADGGLDFVFSSHLLEHLDNTAAALREWFRIIKTGGHLVLYLPHKEFYPNIGEDGANPDHKHDFLPGNIIEIMSMVGGWDLVEAQNRNERTEYSFLQVYRKMKGTKHQRSHETRNPKNKPTCLVIRYGAFGDLIQASSVLPGLKEQGYHITMSTTPKGHDVVAHDPHIDDFSIQDKDQVPNEQLGDYWSALGQEYDKVINLSESVEGTLLGIPGRRTHAMPYAARHVLMNVNYMDFVHSLAEVPPPHKPHFYATSIERKKAAEYRRKLGPAPVIVWTLSGSSLHKSWPWAGEVAAWLLENTDAKIIYEGNQQTQLMEIGIVKMLLDHFLGIGFDDASKMKFSEMLLLLKEHFGGVNRLLCMSGARTIRESMAFIEHANLLIGPETGMLNAASMLPMPKIVMLSHSSHENLTRDWVNTLAIEPKGVDCYPCHRMHYDWELCSEEPLTGAAECAAAITPQEVYKAIVSALGLQKAQETTQPPLVQVNGAGPHSLY